MARFTEKFKDALGAWTDHVMDRMMLGHWGLNLKDEPAEIASGSNDAAAAITATYGRDDASLVLSFEFFTFTPDQQRHFLIHEFTHLYLDGMHTVVNNGPETLMGKPAFTMFDQAFTAQLEKATDRIACVMGGMFVGDEKEHKLWAAVIEAEKDEPPKPTPTRSMPRKSKPPRRPSRPNAAT